MAPGSGYTTLKIKRHFERLAMLGFLHFTDILERVSFRDWMFHGDTLGDGYSVQVRFVGDNSETQHGRKWYVSKHATLSEVVQTCLKAVLTAVEHEAREQFTFDDSAIFSPHFDVMALRGLPHDTRQVPAGALDATAN